jgi:hypothetical protein
LVTSKVRRSVPFEFVLDALTPLEPRTHLMFGCLAVYVGEKIVLMLRNRATEIQDNGVWIATTEEHHASLRREFPKMRSIQLFGGKISGRQVLPVDAPDFETAALRASLCCSKTHGSGRCRTRDGLRLEPKPVRAPNLPGARGRCGVVGRRLSRVRNPLRPESRISIVFRTTTAFMGPGRPPDHTVLSHLAKDRQDARTAGSSPITSNSPHHQPHRCNPPRHHGDPARHLRAPAVPDLR